jgi:hypothetical protein
MTLGCVSTPPTKPVKANCSELCYQSCGDLPDWDGQLASTVNLLGVYGQFFMQCTVKHQACQQCLDKLKTARVIE